MVFSQTTEIQDRNGVLLYKLFHENREYVDREAISPNMINAIVAMEDQRYWTHGGLDPIGILRAWLSRVLPFLWDPGGASTLTQQLLKNLLLNTDGIKETTKDKVIRKLKEFALTSKLEKSLENQIIKEQWKLSDDILRKKMKEKTLELYLNYISFGNNAYGIESAAKTYFGVKASELTVLQSSVLASIPKWPTRYNPLRYYTRVMWSLEVIDPNGKKVILEDIPQLKQLIYDKLTTVLTKANLSNMDDNSAFTQFIKWLWSFSVFYDGMSFRITYKIGRKDAALARMYEDGYINESELKNAFLQGLWFKFRKHRFEIKAPHFVHWVISELETMYDDETLYNGGLIVVTSLDYEMQELAEKAINDNIETVKYYGANNEAMIFVDSLLWDVLAYVGSMDYFDVEIEWQNDMLRSARQIGSTMKPFIYSLWFERVPLTLDTPIYDIPFKAGRDTPNNADGKFYGILPLRNALAYSRNIPAIKMFFALGGEAVAKPFLQDLWFVSLKDEHEYGYPMALWAWEVEMIELASAYMHLSARGKPAKMSPLLEVRASDGSILYKREVEFQKETIKPGVASLLWKILSEKSNMPPGWVPKYSVRWLLLGIKSGTSNMKIDGNKNRARDGLLIGYTPSKVAIFWWWNADGSPMNRNAYGGFLNADALTKFYADLLKNNYITNENMPSVEVSPVSISKISGRLATENTPWEFVISTLWYAYNQVGLADPGATPILYDSLCKWKASPYTPAAEVGNGYLITPTSFMPNNMDLKDIEQWWLESLATSGVDLSDGKTKRPRITYNYYNVFVEELTEFCDGRVPKDDENIQIDILKPSNDGFVATQASLWYHIQWPRKFEKVFVYIDGEQVLTSEYAGKDSLTDIKEIDLSSYSLWKHTMKVEAVDMLWYANATQIEVDLVDDDNQAPTLMEDKVSIKLNEEWRYDVVLLFEDELSSVVWGKLLKDNVLIYEFSSNLASFEMDELSTISVAVTDSAKNILKMDLDLNLYYIN